MNDLIERAKEIMNAHPVDALAWANVSAEMVDEIERLREIESAAKNLVAQKGRHNTQIAYERLVEVLK